MCMSKKVQFSTTLWKVDFKCSSRQWSRTLVKSYKRSFLSFSPLWPEAKMNSNLLPNLKYSHKWHTWSKKIHKTVEKETETMISYSYPHPNRPPPLPPSYKESEEGLTIQVNVPSSTFFFKDLRCFIWDESARSSKYWQSRSSRCLMKIAPGNQILLHIETKYRASIKFCSVPSIKSIESNINNIWHSDYVTFTLISIFQMSLASEVEKRTLYPIDTIFSGWTLECHLIATNILWTNKAFPLPPVF